MTKPVIKGVIRATGLMSAMLLVFCPAPSLHAQAKFQIIHAFGNATGGEMSLDGDDPMAGVVFDQEGNMYGTTTGGGLYGAGTVFELSPTQGGEWIETIIYNFAGGTQDGVGPLGELLIGSGGRFYGTTPGGEPTGLG